MTGGRWAALAVSLAGAGLMVVAALSHGWFTHTGEPRELGGRILPGADLGVGLQSVGECTPDRCFRNEYDSGEQPDELGRKFIATAAATLGLALFASGVLFACAAWVLRRWPPHWLAWAAVVLSGLALGAALALSRLKPPFFQVADQTRWMTDVAAAGWAIPVFVVGAVLGMSAGVLVGVNRPRP